jgi:hypothetical protein
MLDADASAQLGCKVSVKSLTPGTAVIVTISVKTAK